MDFLEDFIEHLPELDETPTKNDQHMPELDQSESDEFLSAMDRATTPIEDVITNFLSAHRSNSTLPTLEQAKTIAILDSINSKYNH